jgi:hypothetical protein
MPRQMRVSGIVVGGPEVTASGELHAEIQFETIDIDRWELFSVDELRLLAEESQSVWPEFEREIMAAFNRHRHDPPMMPNPEYPDSPFDSL